MKSVVQRVQWARVFVNGEVVGRCGPGLLVLAAAHREDTNDNAARLADRLEKLRIFNDEAGKMNLALGDLAETDQPNMLLISNFTVYGETAKNRRPSFTESAPYDEGKQRFDDLVEEIRARGVRCETGIFGADMQVELLNDGPVTVIVEG